MEATNLVPVFTNCCLMLEDYGAEVGSESDGLVSEAEERIGGGDRVLGTTVGNSQLDSFVHGGFSL